MTGVATAFKSTARKTLQDYTCLCKLCLPVFFSSLPELLEKKRLIDLHTNVATAVLDQIKVLNALHYAFNMLKLELKASTMSVNSTLLVCNVSFQYIRLFLIWVVDKDAATMYRNTRSCTHAKSKAGILGFPMVYDMPAIESSYSHQEP